MYNTSLRYGSYVYPRWGKALGVCMGATCCLQILIWAIVAISKETGTLKDVSIAAMSCCGCEVRLHLHQCHTDSAVNAILFSVFNSVPIQFPVFIDYCSLVAAFQKINSPSELMEGKQLEQHRESRGTSGARESGVSIHSHPHRFGLHFNEVGGGEPGVTSQRAAMNAQKRLNTVVKKQNSL